MYIVFIFPQSEIEKAVHQIPHREDLLHQGSWEAGECEEEQI